MQDPLQRFRDQEVSQEEDERAGHELILLVFEHGGVLYAVPASAVDAVVAWHKPAPLPASIPGFAGVVQDRGRIVAVLISPLGKAVEQGGEAPRRIVICSTPRGFLGLPCAETRHIGSVRLASEPAGGDLVDSSSGPVVYVDPITLVRELGVV
jgi:chemotaxis signal transduction protein